jgi:phage repressor protein C with HTH and peptisase S24 domain
MPALPLNQEQKADAERLKVLFKRWQQLRKDAGQPASQDAVAPLFGFGQSALSQYLNGAIPLNVDALTKFAELLGCAPEDISPELAKTIGRYAIYTPTPKQGFAVADEGAVYGGRKSAGKERGTLPWPFPRIPESQLRELPPADLARVEGALALAMAQLGLGVQVTPVLLAAEAQAPASVRSQQPGDVLPPGAAANDDYIEINQYDVRFAAGEGTLAFEANPRNKLAFRRSFLRAERLRAKNLIVVYAQGDSMEPVVPHRAALLIDRGARDLEDGANGKIFGFRLDGELRVKRLERLNDGSICAHSFNPAYKPIHLDGSKDFEIIGRVVWMGTRL